MMTVLRLLLFGILIHWIAVFANGRSLTGPRTVIVQSGSLQLRALVWRPRGRGPFPAILFNHGSGHGAPSPEGDRLVHPMEWQVAKIAPTFVRHGYTFFALFRRGTGPSAGQGVNSSDLWDKELATNGEAARNRMQLRSLETDELNDALAGLAFLRTMPEVDSHRIAVVGHSFGGALTILIAERESGLRAAVVFSGAARSWPESPQLRERLLSAVARTSIPVFMIFPANDYSTAPGEALTAEMARLGKRHRLKIYPPYGRTATEGHSFVYHRIATWEPDVFGFLDGYMRR